MFPPPASSSGRGNGVPQLRVAVQALSSRVIARPARLHAPTVRRSRGWCLVGHPPRRAGLLPQWSCAGVGLGLALSAKGSRRFRPATRAPVTTLEPGDAEEGTGEIAQWKQPWSPALEQQLEQAGAGKPSGNAAGEHDKDEDTWVFFEEQERPTKGRGGKPRVEPLEPLPDPLPSLEPPAEELDSRGKPSAPDDYKFKQAYGRKIAIMDVDGTPIEAPSMTTFEEAAEELNFPPFLRANLAQRGFFHLTPVQQSGMSLLSEGKDFLASAFTGSGKTAAYLLPILTSLDRLSKLVPGMLVAAHYKVRGGGRSSNPTLGRVVGIRRGLAAIEFEQATGVTSRQLIPPPWVVGIPEASALPPWKGPVRPFAVVLVPTRELSEQVHEEARRFTLHSKLRSVPLFGSGNARSQLRDLAHGADILVSTPGKLVDVLHRGVCKLDRVKHLVFDETDRMLELGFGSQLEEIMEAGDMATTTLGGRQTSFWSATIPQSVRDLAEAFLGRECIWVDCTGGESNPVPKTIEHVLVDARPPHRETRKFEAGSEVITTKGRRGVAEFQVGRKWRVMFTDGDLVEHKMLKRGELSLVRLQTEAVKQERLDLLRTVVGSREFARATIIVFCRRRDTVSEVYTYLKERFLGVVVCHGGMTQSARSRSIQAIRNGDAEILVSTDMAARGLDMPNVTHVVNYELPKVLDEFVHRCGRTGRIGRQGTAVTFVTGRESIFNGLRRVIRAQGHGVPEWFSLEGMKLPWRPRFYKSPFTKSKEGPYVGSTARERREYMMKLRDRQYRTQAFVMERAELSVDEAAKAAARERQAELEEDDEDEEERWLELEEEEDQAAGEVPAFSRA